LTSLFYKNIYTVYIFKLNKYKLFVIYIPNV
jgi:hypothetical protein